MIGLHVFWRAAMKVEGQKEVYWPHPTLSGGEGFSSNREFVDSCFVESPLKRPCIQSGDGVRESGSEESRCTEKG